LTQEFDIAVVGGGPGGLAAGLYAARGRRSTVLLEKGVTGGQIALTDIVENYPGIESINGFDLAQAMLKHAEIYGMQTHYVAVKGLERAGQKWLLRAEGEDYLAKAVIITSGADYIRLGVPGETELTGHGVSYCATCDAAFFRDVEVAVVGGGDAAVEEGLFTTRYASKVHLIHRRDQLRASAILQERAFANPKMDFTWNTVVTEITGKDEVTGARLRNVVSGEESVLDVKAVFIFIGQKPNSELLGGLVELDEGGHVPVNEWMEAGQPGLYAAGDIRANSARQVASSVGDGVTAAIAADHYISATFRE